MWNATFEGYFATIAIKENINKRLFIYYSISLDSEFDSENFEKNIFKYGKTKKDIVFIINEKLCTIKAIKTIFQMRNKGFIFAINAEKHNKKILKHFDYIISSRKEFEKNPKWKTIYFDLENNEKDPRPIEKGYDFTTLII